MENVTEPLIKDESQKSSSKSGEARDWIVKLLGFISIFVAILLVINHNYRASYLNTLGLGHMNLEIFIQKSGILDIKMVVLAIALWIFFVSFIRSGSSNIYNLLHYRMVCKLLRGYLIIVVSIFFLILSLSLLLYNETFCKNSCIVIFGLICLDWNCFLPNLNNHAWIGTFVIFSLTFLTLFLLAFFFHFRFMDTTISEINNKGFMVTSIYNARLTFYKFVAPTIFIIVLYMTLFILPVFYGKIKADDEIFIVNRSNPLSVHSLILTSNPCKDIAALIYDPQKKTWSWLPGPIHRIQFLGNVEQYSVIQMIEDDKKQTCLIKNSEIIGMSLSSP